MALVRLTCYGAAFLVGAAFSFYGVVTLANQIVRSYPGAP